MEELVIEDVAKALRALEVLSSKAKLKIVRVLLEKGRASAKEIAEVTGTSLPTVLQHLEDLVSIGLATYEEVKRGAKRVKEYRLTSKRVVIVLDLARLVEDRESKLLDLVAEYLSLRDEGIEVKASPSTYELRKLLKLSDEDAKELASFYRSRIDEVAEVLAEELLTKASGLELTVREISRLLRVDRALAAMVAAKLIEKGLAVAERGKIRVLGGSLKRGDTS